LQHLLRLLQFLFSLLLSGVVVHVDIDEILFHDLADGRVVGDEICETQAPGTPVAAQLADDELAFRLCLAYSLVNLLEGIYAFVVDFLQWCLCAHRHGNERNQKRGNNSSSHMLSEF
jgi:hypothetical protein